MAGRLQRRIEWLFGVLSVSCIMIASLTIDTTTAWGMVSGTLDRAVLVCGVVGAWIWKAYGSVKVRELWADQRYAASALPSFLIVICIAMSGTLEGTFYSRIFGDSHEARSTASDRREDLKADIKRLDKAIAERGVTLSAAEVNAQIASFLGRMVGAPGQQRTVGDMTKDCTLTASLAYVHCGEVLTLRAKLAGGQTADDLLAKRAAAHTELNGLPIVSGGNGVIDAMQTVGGFSPKAILWAISFLAMMLNLIGCVCLPYVLLTRQSSEPQALLQQRSSLPPPPPQIDAAAVEIVPDPITAQTTVVEADPIDMDAEGDDANTSGDQNQKVDEFVDRFIRSRPKAQLPFADIHEVFSLATATNWKARFFGSRLHASLKRRGLEFDKHRIGEEGATAFTGLCFTPEGQATFRHIQSHRQTLVNGMKKASISDRLGVLSPGKSELHEPPAQVN